MHDWSRIKYIRHHRKQDTYAVTHAHDVGYDLQTSLLVNDIDGQPISPIAQRLVSSKGSYATYYDDSDPQTVKNNLDELCDSINSIKNYDLPKPVVHIIDREADSIFHLRKLSDNSQSWLIRAKKVNYVKHRDQRLTLSKVASNLDYKEAGKVNYHGKPHRKFIAETEVIIDRKAVPSQKKGYQSPILGEPLTLRFIVCQLQDNQKNTIAQWLLLTNVTDVSTNIITVWYYWRWRIESFFKLLKKGGHELECWQQENALAISKRLLVVSMACVIVWKIAKAKTKKEIHFRDFLIKLSGKQVKKHFTHNALLTGLWVFLAMSNVLKIYTTKQITEFRQTMDIFV